MQSVSTIDVIAYPLFDLGIPELREKNISLVDRVVGYAQRYGKREGRMFLLHMGTLDYDAKTGPAGDAYSERLELHLREYSRMLGALREATANLYVDIYDTVDQRAQWRANFPGGRFERFLEEKGLALDAQRLRLVGHGLHRDCCVPYLLGVIAAAVGEKYGTAPRWKQHPATTYLQDPIES